MNYSDFSNINLVGALFTLVMGLLMLFLPRKFAAFPLIVTACYITLGQVMDIASLHFTMLRIIIFFGCCRVLFRRELFSIRLHRIDTIIILYMTTSATAYILLRSGSGDAFINQLGFAYNSLGIYFIFRSLIRDMNDIQLIFKMLAFIMLPLAVAMLIENLTGHNFFSVFGGVSEISMVRDGKLRSQGAFAHPILAGTFGATSLPFFIALWVKGKEYKKAAVIGIVSATIITITPSSSGPLVAYLTAIIGLCMWKYRNNMRVIRRSLFFVLSTLALFMNAPIWFLIDHVSDIIGGGGWHRAELIDTTIQHFNEWWLLGTDYTRHWMPTGVDWSEKHTDITNQFIAIGVDGGLGALSVFVAIIIYSFKSIGHKLKEGVHADFPIKYTIWCLGVSLFAHITSFISVHYFDQITVFWYLLLSLITTISLIPLDIATSETKLTRRTKIGPSLPSQQYANGGYPTLNDQ